MKIVIILFSFIVIFSCPLQAQNMSPFDFAEASRKFASLPSQKPEDPATKNCFKAQAGDESVLSCAIKDEDYKAPIVKVDYDADQVPPLIQSALPEKFKEDTKGKKVSCLYRFGLVNDNVAGGIKSGDDYGYTHGQNIGVSCASADGVSTAFTYSTDLFTKPDLKTWHKNPDGTHSMGIKFDSENIFQLLQDDINKGNVTYWKRGVGFINISDKKKWGLLQSTGQQEWMHDIIDQVNKAEATKYQYEEGSRDQWGAFVVLAIGLQENRKFGDSCTLSANADVGARFSTAKGTSTLNLNIQSKLDYQISQNNSLYMRAQSQVTARTTSTIMQNTLAVGAETKTGGFIEAGVTQQVGNREDVYDLPSVIKKNSDGKPKNDTLVFISVGHSF